MRHPWRRKHAMARWRRHHRAKTKTGLLPVTRHTHTHTARSTTWRHTAALSPWTDAYPAFKAAIRRRQLSPSSLTPCSVCVLKLLFFRPRLKGVLYVCFQEMADCYGLASALEQVLDVRATSPDFSIGLHLLSRAIGKCGQCRCAVHGQKIGFQQTYKSRKIAGRA